MPDINQKEPVTPNQKGKTLDDRLKEYKEKVKTKVNPNNLKLEQIPENAANYIKTNVDKSFADEASEILSRGLIYILIAPYNMIIYFCMNLWLLKRKSKIELISLVTCGLITIISVLITVMTGQLQFLAYSGSSIFALVFILWQAEQRIVPSKKKITTMEQSDKSMSDMKSFKI